MMNSIKKASPQFYARMGGLAYLIIIVCGALGEFFIRNKLIVSGDPIATARNITASPALWRLGIAGDLLMHVCDLILGLVYFTLFKRVNRNLALLALLFQMMQTAVLVANKMTLVMPLFLLGNEEYLKAFDPAQLQVWAYLSIKAHGYGFGIGLIFFGFECLLDGYLIFKSGFLPRILGVLIQIAGIGYLINSFTLILFPAWSDVVFKVVMGPVFIAELSMCLWLLVKGVDLGKWKAWPD
jgi:hypothetical protein